MSTLWINLTEFIADTHHSDKRIPGGILECGVVIDLNSAGKARGARIGMTKHEALSFAPDLKLVPANTDLCGAAMRDWLEIARLYTDEIESTGFASAYLSLEKHPDPADVAKCFLDHLERKFAYPYTAGLSPTKWVARALAGYPLVEAPLPGLSLSLKSISILSPLDKSIKERLKLLGYKRVRDVQSLSTEVLKTHFGSFAHRIAAVANGSGGEPVWTNYPPSSVSAEISFTDGCFDSEMVANALSELARKLQAQLSATAQVAKGCELMVTFDEEQSLKSMKQAKPFRGVLGLNLAFKKCFEAMHITKPIQRISVTLPELEKASPRQRMLVGHDTAFTEDALEAVRHKFGCYSVHLGSEHKEPRRILVLREWARQSGWQ